MADTDNNGRNEQASERTPNQPTWRTFRNLENVDRNLWWRLPSGDQRNLFDDAMDEVERLQNSVERLRWAMDGIYRAIGELEVVHELDNLVTLAAMQMLASEALTDTEPKDK